MPQDTPARAPMATPDAPRTTTTRILPPDGRGARLAAAVLRDGGLVAFPTETVYGLGADARNDRAAAALYEAKGRPRFNPLIVHLPSLAAAEAYADIPAPLRDLAAAVWPGPLTVVAPRRPGALSDLAAAGLPTVALRVPAHPTALAILDRFGGPVAAPSANVSGRISPTTAEHVLAHLDGRIDAVVRAGACSVGIESTVVGMEGDAPVLLRPGGLPVEAAARILGRAPGPPTEGGISAPGRLESHYAPNARLRLNADAPRRGERWLGFGPDAHGGANLSPTGDLREAAASLFRILHRLDDGPTVAVAPVPEIGLGVAINDRLRRGAGGASAAGIEVPGGAPGTRFED